ncbi:Ribosomal protein S18 acetylase RimI [Rhizobium aethiopicum]|uniref:Ribosomal protein S18 acetylase RimI n=1 Tax=Rhizobium aethiopicum TaxID=1138170 RepID=A0A1C3Y5K1_9HYPH|nr:GNAT family N-acetyltransferase [Rhizobium aethiopicum]SCB59693.1 Ribosomal protein S18 acetylase RimI [Rhizobium aethiopicum]
MAISIRVGKESDAEAAIAVLRRSITQLCSADHQDDDDEIAGWLSNKTAASWAAWINREDATVLVAELTGNVVGVGMMDGRGEILLNYAHTDARFKGISKGILLALEAQARARGIKMCVLESTRTAKKFYEDRGYEAAAGSTLRLSKRL